MFSHRFHPKKCETEEHGRWRVSFYLTGVKTDRDQVPVRETAYHRLWESGVPDKGVERRRVRILPNWFPSFGGEDEQLAILTTGG
jgi:hypothetical protein